MNRSDKIKRLETLHQQLALIHSYREWFVKDLGKRGTLVLIDDILDEINQIKKALQ